MSTLLGILGLLMQMRNNGDNHSDSYQAKAEAFRKYWLDPNYSYQRSDSKDMFGTPFDFRV